MNESHCVPIEITSIRDDSAAARPKHERLAIARALVVAQFGPAALVDLDFTAAPSIAPGSSRIVIGA